MMWLCHRTVLGIMELFAAVSHNSDRRLLFVLMENVLGSVFFYASLSSD